MESPKRFSKLIFVVLNFVIATSPEAWHCCTRDDVIEVMHVLDLARDLLCLILSHYTYRYLDK